MSGGAARPVALAGFMGTGKTTLGRRLAAALERPFHDTDAEVERRAGRAVQTFFPAAEAEFRALEADVVGNLVAGGPSVIALGGGALLESRTRTLLTERALLVHLHVAWSELEPDIRLLASGRPLLQGRSAPDIERLFREREAVYETAEVRVDVIRGDVDGTLERLLSAVRAALDQRA